MSSTAGADRAMRILLVEDDNHIGRIIELSLAELGLPYEFVSALSAEEGLDQWNQQPFDLVLADYNLRGMNGLKLLALLKEKEPSVATMLVTAYGTGELEHQAHTLGVSAYVSKPFFVDEMIATIRRLLPTDTRVVNGND